MNAWFALLRSIATVATLVAACTTLSADGLLFYYDPLTGNVAFDAAETATGRVVLYGLTLNPSASDFEFRHENHIRSSQSGLFLSEPHSIGDSTLAPDGFQGLHTIGEVLPTGIDKQTWLTMFAQNTFDGPSNHVGTHVYRDVLFGGQLAPRAGFVYGAPDGEFQNRLDLIDPDQLIWASEAFLVYRQRTGELLLDTTGESGGYVSSFRINSSAGFMIENYVPPVESAATLAEANAVGVFADAVKPGEYNLGRLLAPGLTPEEFTQSIGLAKFAGRAGYGNPILDLELETDAVQMSFVFQAVPEPSSLHLLLFCLCVALPHRRSSRDAN